VAEQQFVRFDVRQSLLFVYWRRTTTTINVFRERASNGPEVAWAAHKFNYRVARASSATSTATTIMPAAAAAAAAIKDAR